jgi:transcription elongation factor GreB
MDQDQPVIDIEQDLLQVSLERMNYITPAGFARMQEEVDHLLNTERPKAAEFASCSAENGDYLYGNQRLREIDGRVRFLTKRLRLAEIVDPSHQFNRDQVFFGATVTYVNGRDEEHTICILGVDEADCRRGEVSLHSPIARALLGSRIGDTVSIVSQTTCEAVDVLAIRYPAGCGGR